MKKYLQFLVVPALATMLSMSAANADTLKGLIQKQSEQNKNYLVSWNGSKQLETTSISAPSIAHVIQSMVGQLHIDEASIDSISLLKIDSRTDHPPSM